MTLTVRYPMTKQGINEMGIIIGSFKYVFDHNVLGNPDSWNTESGLIEVIYRIQIACITTEIFVTFVLLYIRNKCCLIHIIPANDLALVLVC